MTGQRTYKLMLPSFAVFLALLFFVLFFVVPFTQAENARQLESSTTLDLSQENWGQGKVFSLQSSWLFAWNVFTHDSSDKHQFTWHQVQVPGAWSDDSTKARAESASLPPVGYGTYYKKIRVPEDVPRVFMHLPDMASAYELWYNGEKLGGNGVIGKNKTQEAAGYLPRVYELRPRNGEIEIFITNSNHHYLWGGIWYAPRLTDESGVYKIRELPVLKAMTAGTLLLATSIFCFFMYLSRKQDAKILFFSLFCLAIGIRRLCMDERVLYMLNIFEWQTLQSMENITLYLMLPLFLSYFQFVFPQSVSKRLPALAWLCALPFCIAALFFQVQIYTSFNPYFQVVVLAFLPFILLGWGRAFRNKHKHSRMFGLSLLILVAAVINDMLNYSYIINTTNLTHMGVLAFVLFQLASLISRYLENFRAIEALSETLQEKNKALVQHDEFKDDFLASTSHELRMPLHGVAGLAKTVRISSPDLSMDSHNKIKLIESTAVRLGNLVNDILDMSSLKHGKLNIQMHPAYIEPLIESTILGLSPLINDKPISLDYKLEEGAGVVFADEQRLQQILYNLIGNAIKFTVEGYIKIDVRKRGSRVQVRITDSGIGMSSEQLKTAMQTYETHSQQAGSELRGSGLGLSITKMLIELHGGSLDIESEEGAGTVVTFTLQASGEVPSTSVENDSSLGSQPTPVAESSVVSDNSLTKEALIFYADDEEVNRELVSSQLLAAGYRVITFPDGQALLDRLELQDEESPELALLDWMMPGKDGLETCRSIRERYDASNLPVIMLTAKHQIHNIVQALNAGANDYLTKPYHEQELIARVSSQISVKRLLMAMIENEHLKVEVARHERQKQELNVSNQRLVKTLEASQENIILLNEDLDIVYANSGANTLLGTNALLGVGSTDSDNIEELALTNFVSTESIKALREYLNDIHSDQALVLELKHENKSVNTTVQTNDVEQDRFVSLILNDKPVSSDQETQGLLTSLTQEIAENRQRMEQIESTLLQLNGAVQPKEQSSLPGTASRRDETDPKELVVKTLRTALISWERYTHKTKAELAEESHCWRVYLDGVTAKTRTLDKYLNVNTLPAKPRWRAVIKTANYVLDHCELSQEDQQELSDLVQQLTQAYS
jgi:signal transduction histidine kinase/DNA-binding response OmpR family regulator